MPSSAGRSNRPSISVSERRHRGRSTCAASPASGRVAIASASSTVRGPLGQHAGGAADELGRRRRGRRSRTAMRSSPSTSRNTTGLASRPSWFQVRISSVSSSVPNPPGRATNPSARSAIRALRSCIESTTSSAVRPGWAISAPTRCSVITPTTSPPPSEHGVGDGAHQPDVAAAVDEAEVPRRRSPTPSRWACVDELRRRARRWNRRTHRSVGTPTREGQDAIAGRRKTPR